jgi:hypothetical protein
MAQAAATSGPQIRRSRCSSALKPGLSSTVAGTQLDRVPDREHHAAARAEDAAHFANGRRSVLEGHQAELTDDRVETRVGEG